MNRLNYKWFYRTDFLDAGLHKKMLDPVNQCINLGLSVNVDGSINFDGKELLSNRFKDNSIFKANLPAATKDVVELLENELKLMGCKVPTIFNFMTIINPYPIPGMKAYGWHKDFNLIDHVQDPLKLWFTMLMLSSDEVTSEFMVSPGPDGPDFWNMGVRTTASSNKLFGHNMNLGHGYFPKEKNQVGVLYIRWYDNVV